MTSRSTASPSRFPSRAAPWTLMCSTVTGFAPGTTSGTLVCTWAMSHDPEATADVIAQAINSLFGFICTLLRIRLLQRIGIDAHAKGAHGDSCRQRSQSLFFAGVDRRLVASGRKCWLWLRRVSGNLHGDGSEVITVHLEQH